MCKNKLWCTVGILGRLRDWSSSKLGWGLLARSTPRSNRQKVKDNYHAENQKLTELRRKQAELNGNLGQDFGPEDVFLTLIDRQAPDCIPTSTMLLQVEVVAMYSGGLVFILQNLASIQTR